MSERDEEKWTLILAKALLKLMALGYPQEEIVGNGLILHALSGMITQTVAL